MPLSLELCPEGDVLTARISGARPANDDDALYTFLTLWGRISDCCREQGFRQLLVLVSVDSRGSSGLSLRFFSSLESVGFTRDIRTAIVFTTQTLRRANQLGLKIASEAGWLVEAFDDESQARHWLGLQTCAKPG